MTYEEACARMSAEEPPEFWVSSAERLEGLLATATRGSVTSLCQSPGGRAVTLVAYGVREECRGRANYNSAVGGQEPGAYADKAAREKPVVLFLGPVHGHEIEGLVGLASLIAVMETGNDLRGRDMSGLKALGDRCRLLIVPTGNPDGLARLKPLSFIGATFDVVRFWAQGTMTDGTVNHWPEVKRIHPMVGDDVGFLGCYFNDAGVNPMHDEFLRPMSTEAPAILGLAIDEAPDLAVSLHSHGAGPTVLRPAYTTTEVQEDVLGLAREYYGLCDARDLPHGKPFGVAPDGGEKPAPFNLVSAIYHASGAAAFTFECPHGTVDEKSCGVTMEQILDIQLTLYEAMLARALAGQG